MDFSFFLSNLRFPWTDSVFTNSSLTALITILTLFSFIYGFVGFLAHGKLDKLVLAAIALTVTTLALCLFMKLVFALTFVAVAAAFMTLFSARRRTRRKTKQIVEDAGAKDVNLPSDPGLTTSQEYLLAEECIKDRDGREAINHLLLCRGKITGQPRYFISYADALMQLGNYSGALAKLNAIPSKQLSRRDVLKNIAFRKALCYHGLYDYVKELECYDILLSKNMQPGVFYFRRVQVKLRMLEVASCLKPVEQAVVDRQDFIDGIYSDLDNVLRYSGQKREQYEGKILSGKGECLVHAGDYQEGQKLLEKAQKIDEFYPNTYVYLGICLYQKRNFTAAIGQLRKAISSEDRPDVASDTACCYLAKIYYKTGKYDDAIQLAAQSLSIFPYRSECFYIQGKCYEHKIMYAEAIKCYTQAIKLEEKADYYRKRARCYYCQSNSSSAKAYRDIQEAVKLDDSSDYRLTALVYKSAMDKGEKIQPDKAQLKEQLAPFQNDPDYFVDIGIIYHNYGYLEESRLYYKGAIEKNPKDYIAHYDLALVLKDMGLYSEAAEELETAIELNSLNAEYYTILADCYQKIGDPANEAVVLVRQDQANKAHCSVNKSNGDAVYRLGKYQEAVKYYLAALSYCRTPAVLNNLACAYYAQGLYENAEESLKEAISLDRKYYLAYFNLGNCQLYMSENSGGRDMQKKAKENYEVSARLNARFEQAPLMVQCMNAGLIEMVIDTAKQQMSKSETFTARG